MPSHALTSDASSARSASTSSAPAARSVATCSGFEILRCVTRTGAPSAMSSCTIFAPILPLAPTTSTRVLSIDVIYHRKEQRDERVILTVAMKHKNTVCLWFDRDAHDAARFYAATFPNSEVTAVHTAPSDFPSGKKGDVLTVEFTVLGIPCLGLNGGPAFKQSEAFSFQVSTADQAETDRYWNAIVGNGGQESACGWCKDKWGLSWQISPIALTKAVFGPDPGVA